MSRNSFVLLSLTATIAVLVAGLAFAVLRLFAAARQMARGQEDAGAETAFMAAAMEEAVSKLRDPRAGDGRPGRSLRAAQRRDHRQPHLRPARRRPRPPRQVAEPGRTAAARHARGGLVGRRCRRAARRGPARRGRSRNASRPGTPVRRRTVQHRRPRTAGPPTSASPCRRSSPCPRTSNGRDLPVQRPHRHRRARGAAAPQGQPGAGRRADRGDRARVPQRPGHDSRLRAAAGSRRGCRPTRVRTCSASATRPTRSARSSGTS